MKHFHFPQRKAFNDSQNKFQCVINFSYICVVLLHLRTWSNRSWGRVTICTSYSQTDLTVHYGHDGSLLPVQLKASIVFNWAGSRRHPDIEWRKYIINENDLANKRENGDQHYKLPHSSLDLLLERTLQLLVTSQPFRKCSQKRKANIFNNGTYTPPLQE